MRTTTQITLLMGAALVSALSLVAPPNALAHCDGLDGPVVKAAQKALDTRNPALILIWVQEKDEPEIRAAFEHTLAVRALSPQAKEKIIQFQSCSPEQSRERSEWNERGCRP